jgi:hypothetical protein
MCVNHDEYYTVTDHLSAGTIVSRARVEEPAIKAIVRRIYGH